MPLFKPDWELLEKLRAQFLAEGFGKESYWNTRETLAQYDHTFAQRIGWKWDSVLKEVKSLNILENFKSFTLVDWGCGTAIASRKFLAHLGSDAVKEIVLLDKSLLAVQFAKDSIAQNHPNLKIETTLPDLGKKQSVLLISHVLNELSQESEKELISLIHKVDIVIWIEPGTPVLSHRLISMRENLKRVFTVLAPCPHQESCGLLKLKETPHWCHFFASPPSAIFRDPFWSEFSRRLQIDLRALPTSFLVLGKLQKSAAKNRRLLGRARHYKGYSLALLCSILGIQEEKLLKRDSKEVIDNMKKNNFTAWLD